MALSPMRRALLAFLAFLVCVSPALAEVRIEASAGGEATSFIEAANADVTCM